MLEHLQKVSKEKGFSDFRKIQKILSYTFEGVPKFCSQWTSKIFSNLFSNSFTTASDQLLMKFLSKNKLEKNEYDGYNYFTEDETHLAINRLNLKSSPGPDGLTSRLYNTSINEFLFNFS